MPACMAVENEMAKINIVALLRFALDSTMQGF
jgi:hypothetical protein